jgi:RNA polymerase sigma factor (sigma-70 family)
MGEMHDQSDAQLLRAYAERGTEAAFAEIVARHTDLVYSAALRQVYSPDLARDATQSVFTDLARKARSVSANLSPAASLVGWLYRGTRFAARDLYRNETRRTQRERQAMEQLHPAPETLPDWEHLRPALDDAMSELDDTDRDAVLLRYFKNHDLRTVGATLGISDDAAQKRVSRAVERLREFFAKRGVTVGTSGLAVVISANAVQAAPVGLALTISTAAALTGTTLATTATVTATKAIAMTALQKTIVTATVAVLAGAGIYEARQAAQLREQVQTLQEQRAPLTEQTAQLNQALFEATNQAAGLSDENQRLKRNNTDVLRLRAETGMLRQQTNRLGNLVSALSAALTATNTTPSLLGQTNFSRESWAFAGFGTPEDTLKSFMWAKSRGDLTTAFTTATPELGQQIKELYFKGKTDEEISTLLVDSAAKQTGFQIMNKLNAADDQVIFQVHIEGASPKSYALLTLRKIDGEWKVSGSEERNIEPTE